MPEYTYLAKSLEDKTVGGTMIAQNVHELSQTLRRRGLFLSKAVSKEEKYKKSINLHFFSGASAIEKIIFAKNLSIMMATGLSLVKSFEILSNQTKSESLKEAILAAAQQINKGQSISSALENYPKVFSEFFLSMIRVGEESGTLEKVLKILSLHLEKEHKLKSEVRGAMIYPIIVLCMILVVGAVVAVFVLPKLKLFFSSMSVPIPFYTKFLIDSGDIALRYWPILIIAPVFLFFGLWMSLKTEQGKWIRDTILLKAPIFSPLIKKNNCAILIRSLSSLLGSGVPMLKSLEVIADTVGNLYFKRAINSASAKVKSGERLSEALVPYREVFPFGAIEMLQVGEETGRTSVVLSSLADFYEDEVISETAKLSSMLEPLLIVFLGVVVGIFAFSIIMPMYSSLGAIQ